MSRETHLCQSSQQRGQLIGFEGREGEEAWGKRRSREETELEKRNRSKRREAHLWHSGQQGGQLH